MAKKKKGFVSEIFGALKPKKLPKVKVPKVKLPKFKLPKRKIWK